jgi:ribosomal protein S18 acetylase RimI-like enzyme
LEVQLDLPAFIYREFVMIRLQPMSDTDFADYKSLVVASYANHLKVEGTDPETARTRATHAIDALLPFQHKTPAHHLFSVKWVEEDALVGYLWIGKDPIGEVHSAYIYDIYIHPESRGLGLGTCALQEAETWAAQSGKSKLTLNVFWHNDGARRLYIRLGYVANRLRMSKVLGDE